MSSDNKKDLNTVREQLLNASLEFFLNDDYHKVTTRAIAERANTNIAMIRYYFGNKEGLYEEMIKETLSKLLDVLDGEMLSTSEGFRDYFHLYYKTMTQHTAFPRLILKVLALNQGPGRRFILQLLERGRVRSRKKLENSKNKGLINADIDPDMVRMSFVSLAMMPMLLKEIFEEQLGYEMDDKFIDELADFNGHIFLTGLTTLKRGK